MTTIGTEFEVLVAKLDLIITELDDLHARIDYLYENDEEIIEKLQNLSLPGGDYSVGLEP